MFEIIVMGFIAGAWALGFWQGKEYQRKKDKPAREDAAALIESMHNLLIKYEKYLTPRGRFLFGILEEGETADELRMKAGYTLGPLGAIKGKEQSK